MGLPVIVVLEGAVSSFNVNNYDTNNNNKKTTLFSFILKLENWHFVIQQRKDDVNNLLIGGIDSTDC